MVVVGGGRWGLVIGCDARVDREGLVTGRSTTESTKESWLVTGRGTTESTEESWLVTGRSTTESTEGGW